MNKSSGTHGSDRDAGGRKKCICDEVMVNSRTIVTEFPHRLGQIRAGCNFFHETFIIYFVFIGLCRAFWSPVTLLTIQIYLETMRIKSFWFQGGDMVGSGKHSCLIARWSPVQFLTCNVSH